MLDLTHPDATVAVAKLRELAHQPARDLIRCLFDPDAVMVKLQPDAHAHYWMTAASVAYDAADLPELQTQQGKAVLAAVFAAATAAATHTKLGR